MEQLYQRAVGLHQVGSLIEARSLYHQVIRRDRRHAGALHLLGVLHLQTGRAGKAARLIQQAIHLSPKNAVQYFNLGNAHQALGEFDEAIAAFEIALDLQPDDPRSWCNKANSLRQSGRHEQAVAAFSQAIALDRASTPAYRGRAAALRALGHPLDALQDCKSALALDPRSLDVHRELLDVLQATGAAPEEVRDACDLALQASPNVPELLVSRGWAHLQSHRVQCALRDFDAALLANPGDAIASWHKAFACLLSGQWALGWKLYESRWSRPDVKSYHVPAPLWLGGGSLQGRSILLHPEQGFGDAVQFCRYAPWVARLGARVTLVLPQSLTGLMASLGPDVSVIEAGQPVSDFDLQCPLMSLPLAFGTTMDNVPSPEGYLRAPAQAVSRWGQMLGAAPGKRIALAWKGRPTHSNDKNRSISLMSLLDALPAHHAYVSLQHEVTQDEERLLRERGVLPLGHLVADFADTAAICALCDVIVSVDTSVAHVSAALGRRTLILLPSFPDWRWGLDSPRTPWYSTATLLRQAVRGQWTQPLSELRLALLSF